MGISGLLPLLKSITNSVHVKEYEGKRVAVDTYSWLHKGALACSKDLLEGRLNKKYVDYCMHRVRLLQHHGVIPVLVFDGGILPMKADQEDKRQRARKESLARAIEHERAGNQSAAYECYQKAVDITPAIAFRLIQVLREENIEFVVAPYEADAQLAFLALQGHVHAVITEDSDMIAYACPRVLYKMDKFGQGMEIQYSDIVKNKELNFTNFTSEMVVEMCILSGCDYLPSLPGMGVKKAHGLIRRLKTYRKVIRHLVFSGVSVPKTYEENFGKALLTFGHQRVFDPRTQELVHLRPLDAAVLADLDFVGPDILPDVARSIARGEVDPVTLRPFQVEEPKQTPAVLLPVSSNMWKGTLKRKNDLPVQRNNLSKYFVPVSASAKKGFKPPRSAVLVETLEDKCSPASDFLSPNNTPREDSEESPPLATPEFGTSLSSSGEDDPFISPPEPSSSPSEDFPSPPSNFDPFMEHEATPSFAEELDFNQTVKRRKSLPFDDNLAGLEFFTTDAAAAFDPLGLGPNLSPDWRVQVRQRKVEAFDYDSEDTLERAQEARTRAFNDDSGEPLEAAERVCFERIDIGFGLVNSQSTPEGEPAELGTHDSFAEDALEMNNYSFSPEPDVDVNRDSQGDAGPSEEQEQALQGNPSSFLQDPALHSFATDVSHVKQYGKIGHRALDQFECTLGIFRHKPGGSQVKVSQGSPAFSQRQNLRRNTSDCPRQARGNCHLETFEDFAHKPSRISPSNKRIYL